MSPLFPGILIHLRCQHDEKPRADHFSTILDEFDFSGHVLNEFVCNCALPYPEEDLPEVRKAAALTCCSIFRRDPVYFQGFNNVMEAFRDIIDKLLKCVLLTWMRQCDNLS